MTLTFFFLGHSHDKFDPCVFIAFRAMNSLLSVCTFFMRARKWSNLYVCVSFSFSGYYFIFLFLNTGTPTADNNRLIATGGQARPGLRALCPDRTRARTIYVCGRAHSGTLRAWFTSDPCSILYWILFDISCEAAWGYGWILRLWLGSFTWAFGDRLWIWSARNVA